MKWFLNFFAIFIFCSAAFGQSLRKKIKQHVKDEEFKYIEAYNKFEESFSVTNREICGKVRTLLNESLEQSMEIFERIGERNARQNFLTFNSTLIGNLSYFLDTIEEELDSKSIRKDFKAGFLITDTLYSRMAFEDYSCIKRFGDDIRNFSSINYQRISQCLRIPMVKIQYYRRISLITVQQIKDGISGIYQKLQDCKDLVGRFDYNCLSNIVSIL